MNLCSNFPSCLNVNIDSCSFEFVNKHCKVFSEITSDKVIFVPFVTAAGFYLLGLLNHFPGPHWHWPGGPGVPRLCPRRLTGSEYQDPRRSPHKRDLTLCTSHRKDSSESV